MHYAEVRNGRFIHGVVCISISICFTYVNSVLQLRHTMANSQPPQTRIPTPSKSVLVAGANGFVGFAVCRAFVRAGWNTYGLVRRPESATNLVAEEVIPIIGSISYAATFTEDLYRHTKAIDVIILCTDIMPGLGASPQDIIYVLKKLASVSKDHSVKPLVIWTSGSKDYGLTGLHGSKDLAPHTEESSLQPIEILKTKAHASLDIFNYSDLFDAVLLRPSPLFGYSGSFYGAVLDFAAATDPGQQLCIPSSLDTIMHGCHVDDCAEAYVSIAGHNDRHAVAGECFNISAHRYETLAEIGAALVEEYGLGGFKSVPTASDITSGFVFGLSQWVASDKLRKLTGWTDKRKLFSENIHVYRGSYEIAVERNDEGVLRIKALLAAIGSEGRELDDAVP